MNARTINIRMIAEGLKPSLKLRYSRSLLLYSMCFIYSVVLIWAFNAEILAVNAWISLFSKEILIGTTSSSSQWDCVICLPYEDVTYIVGGPFDRGSGQMIIPCHIYLAEDGARHGDRRMCSTSSELARWKDDARIRRCLVSSPFLVTASSY